MAILLDGPGLVDADVGRGGSNHRLVGAQKLAGMDDVMALLDTGAPAFASLELVRERYEAEFGNELCWTFPSLV